MMQQGHGFGLPFVVVGDTSGGGAAPPPWQPSDAGTILYQLDVEGSGVLFQDTGGTTPATGAGDIIKRWNATVGGGNITQSTSGAEPQLAIVSGKKRVRCDGVNDRLTNGSQTFAGGAKTVALCWQYTVTPGTSEVDYLALFGLPATGGITRIVQCGSSHASAGLNFNCDAPGSSTALVGIAAATPNTTLRALVFVYNGGSITAAASYKAWLNGTAQTVVARASSLTPGGSTSVGSLSNGNNPATADFMGAIIWSGAIADADAVEACNWMLNRYSP